MEKARIAQENAVTAERISFEEGRRKLEIERNKVVETAEISAREATEAARIAQEKAIAAERIASELETRRLEIQRTEELEAAEIKRRDAVERQRIAAELKIEEERIASTKTREILQIDQKRMVELAEEDRAIVVAAKKAERTDADKALRQAEIVAKQEWSARMWPASRRSKPPASSASA